MEKSVYIIVINWNGWKDTIECLKSIQQLTYNNYRIVLVDNGSEDDSLKQIKSWAAGKIIVKSRYVSYLLDNKNLFIIEYDKRTAEDGGRESSESEISNYPSPNKLVIINNNENLGFAGGCNVGIRYALASGADYIWLLNNDTVVESESLFLLVRYLELNNGFTCVTGTICYYDNPLKICNCGGKVTWYGDRRYYHSNHSVKSLPQNGSRKVTFVTGCAALFRASVFRETGLLTDRFFFGEEDIEFSYRLKRSRQKLACVYDSIIYHKVSSSTGGLSAQLSIGKIYIHLLGRFVNMKSLMPPFIWRAWRLAVLLYIIPMLKIRYGIRWQIIKHLVRMLLRKSFTLDAVTRDEFMSAINGFNEKAKKESSLYPQD
jgi:GT2 family glycosyltransferase